MGSWAHYFAGQTHSRIQRRKIHSIRVFIHPFIFPITLFPQCILLASRNPESRASYFLQIVPRIFFRFAIWTLNDYFISCIFCSCFKEEAVMTNNISRFWSGPKQICYSLMTVFVRVWAFPFFVICKYVFLRTIIIQMIRVAYFSSNEWFNCLSLSWQLGFFKFKLASI